MSGIAGIVYLDQRPVDPVLLNEMADIMAHRGPDGANTWRLGSTGLVHRMLWTTPESLNELMPLSGSGGQLVLTADARIDNRAELIEDLQLSDIPPLQITDSDLILAAYQRWDQDCPARLIGDFAFAIWDAPRQRLFCARDHLGVKPFYYHYQPGRLFVFASEIKGLFCVSEVPRQLNELRVAHYLLAELDDHVETFYQAINRLPPAHTLTVTPESFQTQRYWSLDPANELRLGGNDDYASAFCDLFFEAVRCRLRTAFPLGSTVSGGLDSSAVTCTANTLLAGTANPRLHTFSYIFDNQVQCDERLYIESVLQQGNFAVHFMPGDQHGALIDREQVFWHLEEASIGAMYLPWKLSQVVKAAGVRILLDGFDGDTTVSHGWSYLDELIHTGQWETLAAEVKAIANQNQIAPGEVFKKISRAPLQALAQQGRWTAFANTVTAGARYFDISRRQLWWQSGLKPVIPGPVRRAWQMVRHQNGFGNGADFSIIRPEFARKVNVPWQTLGQRKKHSAFPARQRTEHWKKLTSGVVSLGFELSNRTYAAASIEGRHPFMDKRLVEFCLALPPQQKLQQGWPRWILRQAMIGVLPEKVRLRQDKVDFTSNFIHALVDFEQPTLECILFTNSGVIEPFVDVPAVQTIYQRLIARHNVSADMIMGLWHTVTLALWLEHTGLAA